MAAPGEHLQSGGFGRVHQMPEPFAHLGPTSEHWGHQEPTLTQQHTNGRRWTTDPLPNCSNVQESFGCTWASLNPASRALPLPSSSIRPAPGVASCNTLSRLPTL